MRGKNDEKILLSAGLFDNEFDSFIPFPNNINLRCLTR